MTDNPRSTVSNQSRNFQSELSHIKRHGDRNDQGKGDGGEARKEPEDM